MSDDAPIWLQAMRAATGISEVEGPQSNPKILAMRDYIARKFPEQADYAALFTGDDIAWCGLACAWAMSVADISGPFGSTDTDRWMWALSWADDPNYLPLDEPVLGCVCVFERSGGGHVTLYESTSGSNYMCRGGNQSDAVTLAPYAKSTCVGLFWPSEAGPVPRRDLEEGDSGADVAELQVALGFSPPMCDGDFGPTTEAGVRGFQRGWGLSPDGEVGPGTWAALDDLSARLVVGGERLPETLVGQIAQLAAQSAIARFPWEERGTTPTGYAKGMALSWAVAVQAFNAGDPSAVVMAEGERGQPDSDVLSWYKTELEQLGMDCKVSGLDTMRALWCILWALGPRESSGNHFCGRDQSASNTDAMTCEAGAWQGSWNLSSCSPELPRLMEIFWENPSGFLADWNEGVTTNAANIENYGSGDGARAQWLSKYCPPFAAMITAVGLRKRRNHWGPINRKELDMDGVDIADDLLHQVQELVTGQEPVPPEPPVEQATVSVQITASGPVTVVVNGTPIGEL